MTIWRPAQKIRVKAIGLPWRNGCFLAAEVEGDTGQVKGLRPLGGSVEFGETWQDTLKREFREELDVDIEISGPHHVLENIYHHEGEIGHEVLFMAPVTFSSDAYADQNVISFAEDNGLICRARWVTPDPSERGEIELFPDGLQSLLDQGLLR